MIRPGDYVQTKYRIPFDYGDLERHSRGTVISLDGDWAVIKLPQGRRVEAHVLSLDRIDRAQDL